MRKGISFVFVLVFLASCASYQLDQVVITGKTYPALSPGENVDVVLRAVPDYKVVSIGQIKAYGIMNTEGYNELKTVARNQGGNVIILVETGHANSGVQYTLFEIAKRQ